MLALKKELLKLCKKQGQKGIRKNAPRDRFQRD